MCSQSGAQETVSLGDACATFDLLAKRIDLGCWERRQRLLRTQPEGAADQRGVARLSNKAE